MTELWGRRCRLVVGGVAIESEGERGLRLQFKCTKTLTAKNPNVLEVSIHNLNADTRGRLDGDDEPKLPISLEAGYVEALGAVFTGETVTIAPNTKVPTGWVTKIRAADGHQGREHVSASLGPGATLGKAIEHVLRQLGAGGQVAIDEARARVRKGDVAGAAKAFARGLVLSGSGSDLLERLCRDAGLEYGIDGGEAYLLGEDETRPIDAVVLGSGTGLVGTPEVLRDETVTVTGEIKKTEIGKPTKGAVAATLVRATSLLNCRITPGGRVVLVSETFSGAVRVLKTETTGDTHGQEWTTVLEGRAL